MYAENLPTGLRDFLIKAKNNTYAGSDDDTTVSNPLLAQSKQLEFDESDRFYRDIYYGMSSFSGMEAVYKTGNPLWAMAYSGGTKPGISTSETMQIYAFLRSTLRNVPEEIPVRGPTFFSDGTNTYQMKMNGDLTTFSGHEEVLSNEVVKYSLTFSGGIIR